MRVFMVCNSPGWMFSRHQRGLESLVSQHRDACNVVFSYTIERCERQVSVSEC